MCTGVAIGWRPDSGVVCKGLSSHKDTLKEDIKKYVKFHLLADLTTDDGYKLEFEEPYEPYGPDEYETEEFTPYFTEEGILSKKVFDEVYAWIKSNEAQVLKWLLKSIAMEHTLVKVAGDQDLSYCESGGHQNLSRCKGKSQDMRMCIAEGKQNFRNCEAREQIFRGCSAEETQDFAFCKSKVQYIAYMEIVGDEECSKFLIKLSNKNNLITMAMLVRMAMACEDSKIDEILEGGVKNDSDKS